ncbi:MAG: sigma-70 family RNA polymerase sigma factor [Planctomycetota bacterium]
MAQHDQPPDDAWLRRLARSLTADEATALDLSQDTLVAREIHAPGAGRAWLGTTLRNLWVSRHRERQRRVRRETLAARSECLPATDYIVERIELRESVLAAVRELEDIYREAIVLRYFEDLTPIEIARRSGCPVRTVHTRLHRGLQRLREKLDRRFKDRTRWTTALLAIPPKKSVYLAAWITMLTKTKVVALTAMAVLLGLISLWLQGDPTSLPENTSIELPIVGDAEKQTETATGVRVPTPVLPEIEESDLHDALSSVIANLGSTPTIPIGGMVVDLLARPVPGVEVYYDDFSGHSRSKSTPILTDEEGRFELKRAASMGHVKIGGPQWVAVLEPHIYDNDREHLDLTIVVAPAIELRGTTVDENGERVPGASLWLNFTKDLRSGIPRILDRDVSVTFTATSDEQGSFRFEAAPNSDLVEVVAHAKGRHGATMSLTSVLRGEPIVLKRSRSGDELRGLVLTRDGASVTAATVTLFDLTVTVDDSGNFALPLWQVEQDSSMDRPAELVVSSPGRSPSRLSAIGPHWRTRAAWPADLTLTLGERALTIRGRVVRHDGSPFPSPHVDFVAPAPPWIEPASGSLGNGVYVQRNLDSSLGEFETRPVAAGWYRLRVIVFESLEVHDTDPIEAGRTDVEIRLPHREKWPHLRGRVVDRSGNPVPGADWIIERPHPDHGDGSVVLNGHWHNADPLGRIEHEPLDRSAQFLCVKAAGMAEWKKYAIAELAREGEFRVIVPVGCRASIQLSTRDPAVTMARLFDVKGDASPVVITRGNIAFGTRDIGLTDGASESFVALDDCVELVLYSDGAIVQRIPIQLRPGVDTILRN